MDRLIARGEARQGLLELLAHGFPEIHNWVTWLLLFDVFPAVFHLGRQCCSASGQNQGLKTPVFKLYAKIVAVMRKVFGIWRQKRITTRVPDRPFLWARVSAGPYVRTPSMLAFPVQIWAWQQWILYNKATTKWHHTISFQHWACERFGSFVN